MAALYSRAGPSKKFSGEVVRLVITITGRLTFKLLGLVHQSSMMIGGKKERSQRRLAQTYWDIFLSYLCKTTNNIRMCYLIQSHE